MSTLRDNCIWINCRRVDETSRSTTYHQSPVVETWKWELLRHCNSFCCSDSDERGKTVNDFWKLINSLKQLWTVHFEIRMRRERIGMNPDNTRRSSPVNHSVSNALESFQTSSQVDDETYYRKSCRCTPFWIRKQATTSISQFKISVERQSRSCLFLMAFSFPFLEIRTRTV